MDLPKPPADTELRNIIDKLAQFVARNGPEFEHMTKTKQKNNPKFQFLYGGEYFNYYQYKVTTEQAILKQQGILSKNKTQTSNNIQTNVSSASVANTAISPWTGSSVPIPAPVTSAPTVGGMVTVDQITQQQNTLQEQIRQSEQNLTAQYNVLMQQQQVQIDDTVCRSESEALERLAKDADIDLDALDQLLKPIMDSCTKDSISNGKGWILQHGTTPEKCQAIAGRLLKKVNHETTTFLQKLHVIYLVNDVLHHCARKHADDLKKALEDVVVPMFCNANIGVTPEQKNKLDKLLSLWESKANYFSPETVEKLHNPVESFQDYQASLIAKHAIPIATLTQNTKNTFEGYQAQHNAFVAHAAQQIQVLEQQKQTVIEKQNTFQPPANFQQNNQMPLTFTQPPPPSQYPSNNQSSFMPDDTGNSNQSILSPTSPVPQNQQSQASETSQNQIDFNTSSSNPPPPATNIDNSNNFNQTISNQNLNIPGTNPINPNIPSLPTMHPNVPPPNLPLNSMSELPPFSQPPPRFFDAPPAVFPDFSKPPPGFPVPQFAPPVVEEIFPSIPYYDLPAGLMVPLLKLEDSSYKALNPGAIRLPPPAPPNERLLAAVEAFYGPPSHDRPRDSDGWEKLGLYEYYKAKNMAKKMKDDAIAAGLRPKSKSPSPIVIRRPEKDDSKRRRYSSKSPSPRSPIRRRSGSRSRRERSSRRSRRSRSRSRTRSPPSKRDRSISPPSMMFMPSLRSEDKIDESNKGHQLLKKMGWGGSGLGAKGQGIEAPISGGEIRDRQDQYKGVGINLNDPYESFRKHKGAAFITRMKERAEERAAGERC